MASDTENSSSKSAKEKANNPITTSTSLASTDEAEILLCRSGGSIRPVNNAGASTSVFSVVAWWLPELTAILLSVLALMAIIITLRVYNGRPVATLKLPSSLTLNGIVAALTTLSETLLIVPVGSSMMQETWLYYANGGSKAQLREIEMFHSASRGVLGSVRFLVHFRGRRVLASFGALIIVLSLGFGTFTQQLVSYDLAVPVQEGSTLGPGNIPWVQRWDYYLGSVVSNTATPPLDVVAAMYNGILADGMDTPTVTCPNGNCTWPITPSLGVCGGCTGTTYTNRTVTRKNNLPASIAQFNPPTVDHCIYTLPTGNTAEFPLACNSTGAPYAFYALNNSTGGHHYTNKTGRLYIAQFDLFGRRYNDFFVNHSLVAQECALWWCVRGYNTTTTASRQTQTSEVLSEKVNGTLVHDINEYLAFEPVGKIPHANRTTAFEITGMAGLVFWQFAMQTFNGNVTLLQDDARYSNNLMQGIWSATIDTDAWIAKVARSVSNAIRTLRTIDWPQAEYNGTSYELGVRVRWEWLILPVTTILASILLLLATMVRTARSPVAPWKGSPLAFLLFDIDQEVKDMCYGRDCEYWGIQSAVGKVRVGFRREAGALWKFERM